MNKYEPSVVLRPAQLEQLDEIYALLTADDAWTELNAPYLNYRFPSLETFAQTLFTQLCKGEIAQLIYVNHQPVGAVNFYWQNRRALQLEVGIALYDSSCWGKGIGRQALQMWITQLFMTQSVEQIGLTTWSGNLAMMRCAKRLGFILTERDQGACYYQHYHYDRLQYTLYQSQWSH